MHKGFGDERRDYGNPQGGDRDHNRDREDRNDRGDRRNDRNMGSGAGAPDRGYEKQSSSSSSSQSHYNSGERQFSGDRGGRGGDRPQFERHADRPLNDRTGDRDRERDRSGNHYQQQQRYDNRPQQSGSLRTGPSHGYGGGDQSNFERLRMPRRPQVSYQTESREVFLKTNFIGIDLQKQIDQIYILQIDFTPRIEVDNRVLRDKLVDLCRPQLQKLIGSRYILTGSLIYSTDRPSFNRETSVSTNYQKIDYTLSLRVTKVFRMSDLDSENQKKRQMPLVFFNVMMKNLLRSKNYFEFGKNAKYFEPSAEYHCKVEGTNMVVYRGWSTPFEYYKGGLMMKIDQTLKVARSENVLNHINIIYKLNSEKSRDEKRRLVRDSIVNNSVMASYGNFKQYKVIDVLFDKNCKELKVNDIDSDPCLKQNYLHSRVHQTKQARGSSSSSSSSSNFHSNNNQQQKNSQQQQPFLLNRDEDMSIYDYYFKKYGLKIKFEKQPLLLVHEKKLKRYLYFVPELCVLTGIPAEMNMAQRREISEATRQQPQEIYDMITSFISRLTAPEEKEGDLSSLNIAQSLGIEIQQKPLTIKAKQIPYPYLSYGGNDNQNYRMSAEDMMLNQFELKHPIHSATSQPIQIALIHFKNFNPSDLVNTWNKVQQEQKINVRKPIEFNLGEYTNRAMEQIERVIVQEVRREKFDIAVVVAPNDLSTIANYSKIKQICTLQQEIKSQYIRQSSLEVKSAPVVAAAILNQMAAKCGATLWVAKTPKAMPEMTMIIGASVQKVIIKGQAQFVVGFVASQDPMISKFYSRAVFQRSTKDSIEKIGVLIVDAIRQYFIHNNHVPQNIIFMRDNVAQNYVDKYLRDEVSEIIRSFSELSAQYKPNLCVILLENRHGVKCFANTADDASNPERNNPESMNPQQDNTIVNPPSGIVIDRHITSSYQYDFYIISQNSRTGISNPVLYKVVYDTTGMPEGLLQEILYGQCFNYINWTGVIKYPAQIQYAKKLAKMVGTFILQEVSEKFYSSKFYI